MNSERIEAVRENAEWLQNHSIAANKPEAIRRLSIMKDDVDELIDVIATVQDNERTEATDD
jgi:hypothetical protein